jgi:hypothetical protein
LTTREYHEVDRLFLKSVITIVSILFIIWIFLLGRGELICLSIVSTFWLPARRGGPRSIIVVISGLFMLCSYLLRRNLDAADLLCVHHILLSILQYWGYFSVAVVILLPRESIT